LHQKLEKKYYSAFKSCKNICNLTKKYVYTTNFQLLGQISKKLEKKLDFSACFFRKKEAFACQKKLEKLEIAHFGNTENGSENFS